MSFKKLFTYIFIVVISISFFATKVFAVGNIDSVQKYSQFLNVDLNNNGTNDFINWSPTNGGATVGNSTLTGIIWGETVGWINLNPIAVTYSGHSGTFSRGDSVLGLTSNNTGTVLGDDTSASVLGFSSATGVFTIGETLSDQTSGATATIVAYNSNVVSNTCSGVLGGYAWGQNTGWINFAPTQAIGANQPLINTTTGKITGTVWAQNYGWIQLSSPQTPPTTSYNPSLGLVTSWHGCSGGGVVNGVCGTSNGQTFSSVPNTGLCSPGTSSTPFLSGGNWVWQCTGTGGGTTASCSANQSTTGGGGGGGGSGGGCAYPSTIINGICTLPSGCVSPDVLVNGVCTVPPVPGCTISNALNFNSAATQNDGSCRFPHRVCASPFSIINGICTLSNPILGCTNPVASNFDSHATINDGTCLIVTTPPNIPTIPVILNPVVPAFPHLPIVISSATSNILGDIPKSWDWLLTLIALLGLLSTLPGLISRFENIIFAFIFAHKRARGIVYDSENKEPLDPAYISVVDLATGQEIVNQITDIHGRYGFILKPGTYKLVAGKTHYIFPSQKLMGKTHDEVYSDLYFGQSFTVTDPNQVITMNIPMDRVGVDWNQVDKEKTGIVHAFLKIPSWLATVFDIFFVIGCITSIGITYYYPIWWNFIIVACYAIIIFLRFMGYGPIYAGIIKRQYAPLQFAIVRAFSATLGREIAHTVTSSTGGYYMLVPKGDYYLGIESKNPDGTYTAIAQTAVMRAHAGVISRSLEL